MQDHLFKFPTLDAGNKKNKVNPKQKEENNSNTNRNQGNGEQQQRKLTQFKKLDIDL